MFKYFDLIRQIKDGRRYNQQNSSSVKFQNKKPQNELIFNNGNDIFLNI